MNSTLSVVLVHRNETERGQLRAAFEALAGVQIAGERPDLRAGVALAHSVRPDILVLELSSPVDDVLNAASHYRLENPDTALFFATEVFDPDSLLKAMRAGAQEILRRPLDRGALTAAVDRVAALRARKQGGATTRSVISLFSSKGGSGVSTLAANLAVGLARPGGRRVALADFDAQSGDAAFLLGLSPVRTLADVLAAPRLDSTVIQDALARHESGVCVLSQPEPLDASDGFTGQQIGNVLEILSGTFDHVVVDCPHGFGDVALEIFDRSSAILLVVEPNVGSVRAARRSLEIFQRLNFMVSPDRVRLVVNRTGPGGEVAPGQVKETLGMAVYASVANDYAAVIRAVNAGKPLCEQNPDSRAARDLMALARKLCAVAPAEPALEPVLLRPRASRFRLFSKGRAS